MIAVNEDALVCDFAETYHIYDYRALPPVLAATLAVGLRDSSRIKTYMNGVFASYESYAVAMILDMLNRIRYMLTEDARNGRNHPKSIAESLRKPEEKPKDLKGYDTPEEFYSAVKEYRDA